MDRRASTLIPVGTLAFVLIAGSACTRNDGQTKGADVTPFLATLTGAAEAPTPGETDGQGTAEVSLYPDKGQVCYTIEVSNLDSITAAHIHKGAVGEAGPVTVPLEAPTGGNVSACAKADSSTIQQIAANPSDYYLNVHDAKFPKGAVRGQLKPPK